MYFFLVRLCQTAVESREKSCKGTMNSNARHNLVMSVPDVIFEVLPDVVGGHVAQQFLHRVLTTGSPAAQHMH